MNNYEAGCLEEVAGRCPEYVSVSLAQGYGISMANVSGQETPACNNCITWYQGDCDRFKRFSMP